MGKKYIYAFPKITIKNLFNKKPIRCGRNSKETKSIMLSSGRAALYNAVKILNLKASDTVLVPAYHCGVEIEALIKAGVKIRYYRITRDMAVDKEDLERKTDDGIKALLIIHYWGFPQDLSWLERYSKNKGIALIEDCAHALYSKWENKLLGTFGEVGIYSLSKTLPLPGGGVLRLKQEMVSLNPNRPTKRWYEVKFIIRCILEDMRNQDETRRAMFAELLLTLIEKMRRVEGMENLDYMKKEINIYNEKIGIFTNYLLNCFDPEAIVQRRKENYVILFNNLESIKDWTRHHGGTGSPRGGGRGGSGSVPIGR